MNPFNTCDGEDAASGCAMTQIHVPALFGHTPKPHLYRHRNQWFALYPSNWPMTQVMMRDYELHMGPFLRRVNGITMWQPTSVLVHLETRLQ